MEPTNNHPSEAKPMKCAGCPNSITSRRYLCCFQCKQNYDLVCANVSEERFYNTMTSKHKDNWTCALCNSKIPKSDNSNTPIRPTAPANVNNNRRGAAIPSPPDSPMNPVLIDLSEHNEGNIAQTISSTSVPESLLVEFRSFREEMRATRLQMQNFTAVISKLESRLDSCDTRIDQLSSRMDAIEQRINAGAEHDDKLLQSIEQLKRDINDRDQELLLNDIEITCVPEQQGEGVPHIVMTLATKLGVSLAEQDIISACRVGHPPDPVVMGPSSRPRIIVARFARRAVRDQLLQAARVRRGATTEGTGLTGPSRRFYVNERLTRVNRQLFQRARMHGAQYNWRYVWTRDGKIFVRQHSGKDAPRYRLQSEADITRVFGTTER